MVEFAGLVFDIALEMKRDGCFTDSQELTEEDQTFLRDVFQRQLSSHRLTKKAEEVLEQLDMRK